MVQVLKEVVMSDTSLEFIYVDLSDKEYIEVYLSDISLKLFFKENAKPFHMAMGCSAMNEYVSTEVRSATQPWLWLQQHKHVCLYFFSNGDKKKPSLCVCVGFLRQVLTKFPSMVFNSC